MGSPSRSSSPTRPLLTKRTLPRPSSVSTAISSVPPSSPPRAIYCLCLWSREKVERVADKIQIKVADRRELLKLTLGVPLDKRVAQLFQQRTRVEPDKLLAQKLGHGADVTGMRPERVVDRCKLNARSCTRPRRHQEMRRVHRVNVVGWKGRP